MSTDLTMIMKVLRDCLRVDKERYPLSRIVTVAHDTDRSLRLEDGRWYSPLIDSIEDDLARLGVDCISFARVASSIKGPTAYGKVYAPEGRFARALIGKRISAFFRRGRYPYSYAEERTWSTIFSRTGSRKILGIMPSRELCAAAHRRGMWVADVQHGVIADSHPWYGAAFRSKDPREQLPDAFLCWDPGSAAAISKWAAPRGIAVEVIGNPWLARFIRNSADDALVRQLAGGYRLASAALGPRRPTILVTLSWGDDMNSNSFVDPGLRAVISSTSQRFRWLIRLHPNQISGFASDEGKAFLGFFEKHLKGHAEWELPTRAPLPAVLGDTDLHISWYSSVAIEAAQMGIASALLAPALRANGKFSDYFVYQRHIGIVDFVAEDERSILAWIERRLDFRGAIDDALNEYDAAYRRVLSFVAEN